LHASIKIALKKIVTSGAMCPAPPFEPSHNHPFLLGSKGDFNAAEQRVPLPFSPILSLHGIYFYF
jgi:hypothetical protein